MDKWEPFMQASQSGYLVRRLDRLVEALRRDGVRHWVTYRRDDVPSVSVLDDWGQRNPTERVFIRRDPYDAKPSNEVRAEIRRRRDANRQRRALADGQRSYKRQAGSSVMDVVEQHRHDGPEGAPGAVLLAQEKKPPSPKTRDDEPGPDLWRTHPKPAGGPPQWAGGGEPAAPAEEPQNEDKPGPLNIPWVHKFDAPAANDTLYTVWVAVPGGVTYTFSSFRLDAALAEGAVPFKRPCDGPVALVHRMLGDEGLDGYHQNSWENV